MAETPKMTQGCMEPPYSEEEGPPTKKQRMSDGDDKKLKNI